MAEAGRAESGVGFWSGVSQPLYTRPRGLGSAVSSPVRSEAKLKPPRGKGEWKAEEWKWPLIFQNVVAWLVLFGHWRVTRLGGPQEH